MITQRKDGSDINQTKIIDQIRCLGIDMINEAKSGHPGIVLGAAPIIYTLYAHHLKFDPKNPKFYNRDRFVMSAGHGSALLYSTLYMSGFDLTLDDLKAFRQIDSKTPGHPEYGVTPGVDMTTGPLGQGLASAVGMAISEAYLRNRYQKNKVIDYYTYVLCGDGDLMEGVTYEAISLAGTLKLNKLIVLYDSNDICLDGKTNKTFNENIAMRFVSMGWNVITVDDGESYEAISKAIDAAKLSTDKPTLIEIKTVIGKYSSVQGTSKAHGSPLSQEDITNIKEKLGVRDIPFTVSQTPIDDMTYLIEERNKGISEDFDKLVETLDEETKKELNYLMGEDKTISLKDLEYTPPEASEESPRVTSGKILNGISEFVPYLLGGSADLFAANKTYIEDGGDFNSDNYSGKNIFFGVREHAMGAILNGMALCGLRPYGSTFLSFSDYLRPSMRLACMMNLPVTYIFTHDSITVGEDGPTHQPVEQLIALRSMPNMEVFRPADINEVLGAYKTIFEKTSSPAAICLSRNSLPIMTTTKSSEVEKGGYIVLDTPKKPDGIIIASGEEVHTAIEVAERLKVKGIDIRVVSIPNLNRFLNQSDEYIEEILPVEVRKIVIDTSPAYSWHTLIYNEKYLITLENFGSSGPKNDVLKKYGFDPDALEQKVEELLK